MAIEMGHKSVLTSVQALVLELALGSELESAAVSGQGSELELEPE